MAQLVEHVRELLTLHARGRFVDMERRARAALQAYPEAPMLCELLGMALSVQNRHSEALSALQDAVRGEPNDAQFWENLALCQRQLGQFENAASSLRRSLAIRPQSVEALNALASVLRSLGRSAEARAVFEQVLALAPSHVGANVNLAKAFVEERRYAEADRALTRAIDALNKAGGGISAQNVEVWDTIASVLNGLRRYEDATGIYKATCRFELTPRRAVAAIVSARRVCDWVFASLLEPVACAAARADPDTVSAGFDTLLYMTGASPQYQLATARSYARTFMAGRAATIRRQESKQESKQGVSRKQRRLRIGYLSNDFCNHPVGYALAGVIEAHDRDRFDVRAFDYSSVPENDAYRRRFQASFGTVEMIGERSDVEAAQLIADSEIDIAIDLKGWTTGERAGVLVPRPAPLQVQWLGYPATMGAPWIDYIIADRVLIPEGREGDFSEKIIRLPDTGMPCERGHLGDKPGREECGLSPDAFVFCSFNQAVKITPEMFEVWMKILGAIEGSVLWLQQADAVVVAALREFALRHGIEPARIVFAQFVPRRDDHLSRLANADLALDCAPYGSHVTACDALSAGIPLVALKGDTLASRVASSVLTAAGMSDLVTTSLDEYLHLAVALARDRGRLAALKSRLMEPSTTIKLFDTRRFTRNLEAALMAVWERHAAGLPPDHVTVDA